MERSHAIPMTSTRHPLSASFRPDGCRSLTAWGYIAVQSTGLVARVQWKPVVTEGVGIRGALVARKVCGLSGNTKATASSAFRGPGTGTLGEMVRVMGLPWQGGASPSRFGRATVRAVRSGHGQVTAKPCDKARDTAVPCVTQTATGHNLPKERLRRTMASSRIGAYSVVPRSQRPTLVATPNGDRPADRNTR